MFLFYKIIAHKRKPNEKEIVLRTKADHVKHALNNIHKEWKKYYFEPNNDKSVNLSQFNLPFPSAKEWFENDACKPPTNCQEIDVGEFAEFDLNGSQHTWFEMMYWLCCARCSFPDSDDYKAQYAAEKLKQIPYLTKDLKVLATDTVKMAAHIKTIKTLRFKNLDDEIDKELSEVIIKKINAYETMTQDEKLRIPLNSAIEHAIPLNGKHCWCGGSYVGEITNVNNDSFTIKNRSNELEKISDEDYAKYEIGIYTPRTKKLWNWCFVLAKEMSQHYVKEFDTFNKLGLFKVLTIIPNVLIDDLADNLGQHELVNIIRDYIMNSFDISWDKPLTRDAIKQELNEKKNKLKSDFNCKFAGEDIEFKPYVNCLFDIWDELLIQLYEHFNPDNQVPDSNSDSTSSTPPTYDHTTLQNFFKDMKSDYEKILDQFKLASGFSNTKVMENFKQMVCDEKGIAFNMNMCPMELYDRLEFHRIKKSPFYNEKKYFEKFREHVLVPVQFCGQTANHVATLKREISDQEEGNPIIWLLPLMSKHMARELIVLNNVNQQAQDGVIKRIQEYVENNYVEILTIARIASVTESVKNKIAEWEKNAKNDPEPIERDKFLKLAGQGKAYLKSGQFLTLSYLAFKSKL